MKIYVIDTETTGLNGAVCGEKVVEIGIARVDTEKKTVKKCYDGRVRQYLSDKDKESWIFTNDKATLTPNKIRFALRNEEMTSRKLRFILEGQKITSYNTEFDFDRFLTPIYHLPDYTIEMPDIMAICDSIPELNEYKHTHKDGSSHVSMKNSYKVLCPDNPAKINEQPHRAYVDALMESYILLELVGRGYYAE